MSSANELNLSGGSSTHLNALYGVAGSAATASDNVNSGSRSILKELNTNESNAMLNPLSGKAILNNSKLSTSSTKYSSASNIQIPPNTPTTSTTAAGSVSSVFESNSSELEVSLFDDHQQKNLRDENQQHLTTKDHLNATGGKKLSNKFVGLTEYDETKIPELPDDLNSNIEEQYNITFEECFIPTLTAQQEIKVTDEFGIDGTHLLLPTEVDTVSSDNETFADCNDDRDTMATTLSKTSNMDAATDLDSYRSAVNNTMHEMSINDTMENIADLAKEVEVYPLQKTNETLVIEGCKNEHNQIYDYMQEDEPMDVDMNSTIEIMQNTLNNIQQVENVLCNTESIQQNEEKKHVEESKQKNFFSDINTTVECSTENTNNFETEQSKHETKNLQCNIAQNKSETDELLHSKTGVTNNLNETVDCINSSVISNSSIKSSGDQNGETKSITLNTSVSSQKSTAPSSPSFPIKKNQNEGFPRSTKALINKQPESTFLEKSNYADNFQEQEKNTSANSANCCLTEFNSNGKSLELNTADNDNRLSQTPEKDELEANAFAKNSLQTLSADLQNTEEKRRTFSIQSHETQNTNIQFPAAVNKPDDNTRRTFCINETSTKPEDISNQNNKNARRTFNINLEEIEATQTAVEAMDVDSAENEKQLSSQVVSIMHQGSQSIESLVTMQQRSQPPAVPVTKQNSLSPPLPTVRQKTQSPPLPTMQQSSQTPISLSQPLPEVQQRSISPPLPTLLQKSQYPIVPAVQQRSQSPPLPTLEKISQSPPLPAMQQQKPRIQPVQLSSLQQQTIIIKEEQISPTLDNVVASSSFNPQSQPLPTLIQKRPPIRDIRTRPDILSAKEQSSIKVKDEKDVFVEKGTPSPTEEVFTAVSATSTTLTNTSGFSEFDQISLSSSSSLNKNTEEQQEQFEEEFGGNNNIILNPSDFDYLLTKGNNNTTVDRSSLLLKFDPFLGVPVPVNQGPQQQQQLQQQLQLQIPTNTINTYLSPTLEEDEHNDTTRSFVIETTVDGVEGGSTEHSAKILKERSQEAKQQLEFGSQAAQQNNNFLKQGVNKKNATMSVDVIKDMSLDNDCNKAFENSNSTQSDEKQNNYKMDELEKKIKNEVLKTEDIEKKLKDAEQREEALIKRITEKDKTVAKMTGVIEAYEKAIAELIAEKEQLIQNYEKQLAEVKADRDSNYHHLTSLETTFSDLHVKYEKSKEMTCQLKASEEALQAEKRKNLENLHLQEQRYDKMKNHAMQQLEIANNKLESLTRDHSIEITKLKALLKKEEIARSSINEQLAQKTKENAELVKICDELIANQGS